jgi:glucose/arabinose dehydrogenase
MKRPIGLTAARAVSIGVIAGAGLFIHPLAQAQTPTLVDPSLSVSTVVGGLSQPIAMAFIGPNDILVTEKASGQVKRVTNGVVAGVVLDLPVNSNSERGLLGMALHPRFPRTPYVYLYNTESTTGADSAAVAEVPLLGNRVDRFVWDGSKLTFDRNIIKLRSFQNDLNNVINPAAPLPLLRGNHNGGVLRFGPDRKLYVIIGDNGRRGYTQNNLLGPTPDDAFGGPEPDDAHLTGVILRLNDDGSTPRDNPFYRLGKAGVRDDDDDDNDADDDSDVSRAIAALGDEVRKNLQRIFAYGVRNSFGMTFDPKRGDLWTTENGGRAFDEINRVRPGFNGGWVQIMGPLSRVAEFKQIEVGVGVNAANGSPTGLQQARFPASRIADTPEEARSRTFHLPGSRLTDPQFSWKQVVPPAALGFINGNGLGDQYNGDLIVGSAVARAANPGHLYRFRLNQRRTAFVFDDPRLQDKVADNLALDDFTTEGEEIRFGSNFGIVTHIETGADGALYLVSPNTGTIRKISKN